MPIKNKGVFPGAFWIEPRKYVRIGTRGTRPLLLVGWSGSSFGSGEPLVSSPVTDNPENEDLGVSELDTLLGHGSLAMDIKITIDPDSLKGKPNSNKGFDKNRYDRYRTR